MWKVNGRRTPSDGKSSHCLWHGELIKNGDELSCSGKQFLLLIWHQLCYSLQIRIQVINDERTDYNYDNMNMLSTCLYQTRNYIQFQKGHRGRDCMVVGFTMCNQCLSPLTLWVLILLMLRCTRYNIMW